MNCVYNVMYIYGLKYFDVSTGAFTISLTVVTIPLVLIAMRRSVELKTWISASIIMLMQEELGAVPIRPAREGRTI